VKTYIILRHAKSDWSNLYLPDFDRELNERGLHDAPMMGKRLLNRNIPIDLILSSTARRATETAKAVAAQIGFISNHIQYRDDLYHASPDTIADHLMTIDNSIQSVLLVCHNPGITYFVNQQCGHITYNVPTCGMIAFELQSDDWTQFLTANKRFLFYDFPKNQA
jgi:phosphohistidine phosphatase